MLMTPTDHSAVDIPPSVKRYQITHAHKHRTLRFGDVVVMTKTPKWENLLIRLNDMTLHQLSDDSGQYVHLA